MKNIDIPNFAKLNIANIVLDYNGTIAKDGKLKDIPLKKICELFNVYVITADTFGSVKSELRDFDLEVVVLQSENHTAEKADFVKSLTKENTISLGNGNNDEQMLKTSAISIAIIGDEGCSTKALLASDIVCNSITNAIELLLNEKRLIATLRR
jgi:soluble P-type ATPase